MEVFLSILLAKRTTFALFTRFTMLLYFPLKMTPFFRFSSTCRLILDSTNLVMSNMNSVFSVSRAYATSSLLVLLNTYPFSTSDRYCPSHVLPWFPLSSTMKSISRLPWILMSFLATCCHSLSVEFS